MCYAITFVLALVNLIFYFFIREKPFLLYSVYMLLVLNSLVWQEGWIGRLVSLDGTVWVERALHSFAVLPVLAYYAFFRSYLGLSPKTWSGRFAVLRTQSLDKEVVAGLREFVEKAVHARMDAENMWELQHSATFDLLTGVYNRATMEMHIASALEQGGETGRGLSLAFVDIDHFKLLNDSKGHDFGDDCLRLLCRTMREILPVDAVIGRFGGDEFLVLLPGADYLQASQHLAGLNLGLWERMSESDDSLTVSVGIAECLAGQKMPMTELLKNADRSLYAAKAAGKGQIGDKVDYG